MIGLGGTSGIDAISRAEQLLDRSANKIAQGPPSPDSMAGLLLAKEQFSAGIKLVKTEDELTKSVLDLYA